jgi:transcriptional regulator with XRE-family HTH domain
VAQHRRIDVIHSFGSRVRERRLALGLSQEDQAERADLDRTYISGIERGLRNVSLVNIARLASALRMKVRDLF